MNFIFQYIDVFWLILAILIVDKNQRWTALGFILGCMILLRMQVELMYSIEYPSGIFNFLGNSVMQRGLMFYSALYLVYFITLHYARDNDKSIVMASSIGMFFVAFALSSVLMIL